MANLSYAAQNQEQMDWWIGVKDNTQKLKKVLSVYFVRCPPTPATTKRKKFDIFNYVEEERREQQLLLDGVLEMMDERHYGAWMAKPKNGCVDGETAKVMWQELCKTPGAILDNKGKSAKFIRRVAVQKADFVINRDASIQSQRGECVRQTKKPDDVKLKELMAEVRSRPGLEAGRSRADMASSMVKAKTASNGEGAFSSAGTAASNIGDVVDLCPADDDEEGNASKAIPKSTDEKAAGTDGTSSTRSSRGPAVKRAWFNRDDAIATFVSAERNYRKKVRSDYEAMVKVMAAVEGIAKDDEEVKGMVENELKLMKTRQTAVRLVVGDVEVVPQILGSAPAEPAVTANVADKGGVKATDVAGTSLLPGSDVDGKGEKVGAGGSGAAPSGPGTSPEAADAAAPAPSESPTALVAACGDSARALRKYIAKFSSTAIPKNSSVVEALGFAPPCRSYRSLCVIKDFERCDAEALECESKEQIASLKQKYKPFKSALQELLGMAKASANRLGSAIKKAEQSIEAGKVEKTSGTKRKKGDDDDKGPKASTTSSPAKSAAEQKERANKMSVFWDRAASIALPFQHKTILNGEADTKLDNANWLIPCVFALYSDFPLFTAAQETATKVDAMETKFSKDPSRLDLGRAQKKVGDPAGDEINATLRRFIPEYVAIPFAKYASVDLDEYKQPVIYAIAKGQTTAAAEPNHFASFRVGFKGTRQVLATPFSAIAAYVSKKTATNAKPADVYHFLKTVSPEGLKEYGDADNAMFIGTVGLRDCLYLPAGWCMIEAVGASTDVVGVRILFFGTVHLPEMEKLDRHLIACGKANPKVQAMLDCLNNNS